MIRSWVEIAGVAVAILVGISGLAGTIRAGLGRRRHVRLAAEAAQLSRDAQELGDSTPAADALRRLQMHHTVEYVVLADSHRNRDARGLWLLGLILVGASVSCALLWSAATAAADHNEWLASWVIMTLVLLPAVGLSARRWQVRLDRHDRYIELGGPEPQATRDEIETKRAESGYYWFGMASACVGFAGLATFDAPNVVFTAAVLGPLTVLISWCAARADTYEAIHAVSKNSHTWVKQRRQAILGTNRESPADDTAKRAHHTRER